MFSAKDVEVGTGSKYQRAGVSEKVTITEFTINENQQYNTKAIQFKTINENGEVGNSKRLSLTTEVREGKKTSGWNITAQALISIIRSATGKSVDEAKAVLDAKDENDLVNKLSKTLIGKPFRGLFSSREYAPGKFYIELFKTENIGGTSLTYDYNNPKHNERLPKSESTTTNTVVADEMPF